MNACWGNGKIAGDDIMGGSQSDQTAGKTAKNINEPDWPKVVEINRFEN
jgi:hypothetical protein